MKYFLSSLTKNAFTWFTTLPPGSIDTWSHLERLFHEKFYMGQTKISLKELTNIKRKFTEPIDDYLNRFSFLKAKCFTVVHEHELVEMATGGLDYSIRKKLDTQYLRNMAQLADRERVAYVEADEGEPKIFEDQYGFEDFEVDLAELKDAAPYSCKLLTPSNGKNHAENEKNDKFPKKTYTFDVTKCDEIFDLLVKDGQMVIPPNTKVPPLEQRKKRGYFKYHNFLGHRTSQCFLFRDLIQNVIKEGRLRFGDKGKNQEKVDADPLNIADTNYAEPVNVNMVDMVEVEAKEISENEGYVLIGKKATNSLEYDVTFGTAVKGK
ncbi:uncharacterized protein LOC131659057 [Vicia villosa]|uniref:uncharacterized protein LOC131659057 n=1 Tax=Vicia villosa TaxID=3911 RepID=UPI00273BDDE8|nr:uncharacterized protein LOC131659057 [Vicia villosa]